HPQGGSLHDPQIDLCEEIAGGVSWRGLDGAGRSVAPSHGCHSPSCCTSDARGCGFRPGITTRTSPRPWLRRLGLAPALLQKSVSLLLTLRSATACSRDRPRCAPRAS